MMESSISARPVYAENLIRFCNGSAALTVEFLQKANTEFTKHFEAVGIDDPTWIKYELHGMQFIDAFYTARKTMQAISNAQGGAEQASQNEASSSRTAAALASGSTPKLDTRADRRAAQKDAKKAAKKAGKKKA